MKIVVCDDSKAMRMIVTRMLHGSGFADAEIIEAADGAEGLQAVADHAPDLVLSDWNMPNLTGIEFLQQLRARGDQTTFGFVTSESTPKMRQLAIRHGAAFTLAKPFNATQFAEVVGGVAARGGI